MLRWDEIKDEPCSIARTLSVVGERWTLLILRNCFMGERRFEGFQKQLGLTRHLLASRLKSLVDQGVLNKVPYQQKPLRYEYKFTAKGLELYPIIMALGQWGDRWMSPDGAPLEYEHKACGKKTRLIFACSECREPVQATDIIPKLGPGIKPYLKNPDFQERWGELLARRQEK